MRTAGARVENAYGLERARAGVTTDLVHWTGALHRFSSRDAVIVVRSVLEKHFDSHFTPEKEITFKRWPPGYQSLKLGLALNRLRDAGKLTIVLPMGH